MITFGQLYFGCSKLALNKSQMLSGSLGHIPVTFGRWWLANGGQWVVWTVITLALNKLQTIKVCNKPNRLKWLLKWLQNALWQIVKSLKCQIVTFDCLSTCLYQIISCQLPFYAVLEWRIYREWSSLCRWWLSSLFNYK